MLRILSVIVLLTFVWASHIPVAMADTSPTRVDLYIETNGSVDLGSTHFTDDTTLGAALARLAKKQPNIDIHVRGDKTVSFERVGHVILLIQKSGIKFGKVGFMTEPKN